MPELKMKCQMLFAEGTPDKDKREGCAFHRHT